MRIDSTAARDYHLSASNRAPARRSHCGPPEPPGEAMMTPESPQGITVEQVREIVRSEVAPVSSGLTAVNSNIAHLTQKVDAVDEFMRGDRAGSRAGVVTRIDRIEQANDREQWWRRVSITGAIAALGAAAASWFKH